MLLCRKHKDLLFLLSTKGYSDIPGELLYQITDNCRAGEFPGKLRAHKKVLCLRIYKFIVPDNIQVMTIKDSRDFVDKPCFVPAVNKKNVSCTVDRFHNTFVSLYEKILSSEYPAPVIRASVYRI